MVSCNRDNFFIPLPDRQGVCTCRQVVWRISIKMVSPLRTLSSGFTQYYYLLKNNNLHQKSPGTIPPVIFAVYLGVDFASI